MLTQNVKDKSYYQRLIDARKANISLKEKEIKKLYIEIESLKELKEAAPNGIVRK